MFVGYIIYKYFFQSVVGLFILLTVQKFYTLIKSSLSVICFFFGELCFWCHVQELWLQKFSLLLSCKCVTVLCLILCLKINFQLIFNSIWGLGFILEISLAIYLIYRLMMSLQCSVFISRNMIIFSIYSSFLSYPIKFYSFIHIHLAHFNILVYSYIFYSFCCYLNSKNRFFIIFINSL